MPWNPNLQSPWTVTWNSQFRLRPFSSYRSYSKHVKWYCHRSKTQNRISDKSYIIYILSGLHSGTQNIRWAYGAMTPSSKAYHEWELLTLQFSHQTKSRHTKYMVKDGSDFRNQILLVCCVKLSITLIIASELEERLTCGLKRNFVESGQNLRR